jgi:hypothetical protein
MHRHSTGTQPLARQRLGDLPESPVLGNEIPRFPKLSVPILGLFEVTPVSYARQIQHPIPRHITSHPLACIFRRVASLQRALGLAAQSHLSNGTMGEDRDTGRRKMPTPAGCIVSAADTPFVVISVACFAAFIAYGACSGALGAAVPGLSRALGRSEARVGLAFTVRGGGFLAATFGSAAVMGVQHKLPFSTEVLTCLGAVLMGVATLCMALTESYSLVLALSVIQGVGFGMIDTLSNCLLPELWRGRIGPWMQGLHMCYGVGAMVGPGLVGYVGYESTYLIVGTCAFLPLLGLLGYRLGLRLLYGREAADAISAGGGGGGGGGGGSGGC